MKWEKLTERKSRYANVWHFLSWFRLNIWEGKHSLEGGNEHEVDIGTDIDMWYGTKDSFSVSVVYVSIYS